METARREWRERQPTDLSRAAGYGNRLTGRVLVVPEEFVYLYEIVLPAATYQRIALRADPARKLGYLEGFLKLHGISPATTRTLFNSFNEKEQVLWLHASAAAQHRDRQPREVFVYTEERTERTTIGSESRSEAIQRFQQLSQAAILLSGPEPSLGVPVWHGEKWYWYTSQR